MSPCVAGLCLVLALLAACTALFVGAVLSAPVADEPPSRLDVLDGQGERS